MEMLYLPKSKELINEFIGKNGLGDFLASDPNIYIGGSLPFMCLSPNISNIDDLEVGDIDIYTKNCPLLLRNINRSFNVKNIIKTGVNIKFDIDESSVPIQIITSPFDNFCSDVLDEYDCDMVSVGYHPYSNEFIIHDRFLQGLKKKSFVVIHERTNPSKVKKLTKRAMELFGSNVVEIWETNSGSDYRPNWKNKIALKSINNIMPSPPYTKI